MLLASLIVFHDLAEALIGDVPEFTSIQLAASTYLSDKEKEEAEENANQLLLQALPTDLQQLFKITLSLTSEGNSQLYKFFHMVDKSDSIIAVWRYIFTFQEKINIDHFVTVMSDFFHNPKPQQVCVNSKTLALVQFLQNKEHAKNYHQNQSRFFHNFFDNETATELHRLIEERKMRFT